MRIVQHRVVLQYGKTGDFKSSSTTVSPGEAGKFVALDRASGGYPYDVELDLAHDFVTEERAIGYAGNFPGLRPRRVTVTFQVEDQ
jgi:hypothetical protein